MFTQASAIEIVVIVAIGVLGFYYWVLYRSGILKPTDAKVSTPGVQVNNTDIIPKQVLTEGGFTKMALPPAIGSTSLVEEMLEDDETLEFIDDEGSVLLKEAEKVVDIIQDTINHIASNPPNPEEVTSKIKAVVSSYKLLQDTEYFDSINTYIALAVERDCNIKMSSEYLQTLWN